MVVERWRDNKSVAGQMTMFACWRDGKSVVGQMTVPWLCRLSLTCCLSRQQCWRWGGGQCLLVGATHVGIKADDGALASVSVPCLLVQQRRWRGGRRCLGIVGLPCSLAQQWRWRQGGRRCLIADTTTSQQRVRRWCSLTGVTTNHWRVG